MSYLSDRQIASILRNGQYPEGDLIEWEDEKKNELLAAVIASMKADDRAEVFQEVVMQTSGRGLSWLFTDAARFGQDFGCGVYLYLEDQLSKQITSARDLIEKEAA